MSITLTVGECLATHKGQQHRHRERRTLIRVANGIDFVSEYFRVEFAHARQLKSCWQIRIQSDFYVRITSMGWTIPSPGSAVTTVASTAAQLKRNHKIHCNDSSGVGAFVSNWWEHAKLVLKTEAENMKRCSGRTHKHKTVSTTRHLHSRYRYTLRCHVHWRHSLSIFYSLSLSLFFSLFISFSISRSLSVCSMEMNKKKRDLKNKAKTNGAMFSN